MTCHFITTIRKAFKLFSIFAHRIPSQTQFDFFLSLYVCFAYVKQERYTYSCATYSSYIQHASVCMCGEQRVFGFGLRFKRTSLNFILYWQGPRSWIDALRKCLYMYEPNILVSPIRFVICCFFFTVRVADGVSILPWQLLAKKRISGLQSRFVSISLSIELYFFSWHLRTNKRTPTVSEFQRCPMK